MIAQIKIYLIGALSLLAGLLAFLLQNSKLKAKTEELRTAKKTAQINKDVAKILANRNIVEILDHVDEKIKNGDVSGLDS